MAAQRVAKALHSFACWNTGAPCISTGVVQALACLFPWDAQAELDLAQQAAESRTGAGIHFRSDVIAGTTLGQKVGAKVAWAKVDGS